jgi:alkaline phosphatase
MVDATPAAFGAHSVTRTALGDIARQMGTAGIRVLIGGGRRAFEPALQPDSVDLLAELQRQYTYVADADQLRALNPDTVNTLLALLAEDDMGIVETRGATTFRDMVSTALRIVSRESNGFFLMIENEESDTQAHRNASEEILVAEMLDFDAAVGMALDYQTEHPDVLVLVTGDHETGGVSLTYDEDRNAIMTYTTQTHTGTLIPIFAAGPGAERFSGILDNYRVGELLMDIVRQK